MDFTILIVDDSPINLGILKTFLSTLPVQILTATSSEQALEIMQKEHISLLLTDIMMDGDLRSGVELARQARAMSKYAFLPILAITCDGNFTNTEDEIFDDVIYRPLSAQRLVEQVSQYLPTF